MKESNPKPPHWGVGGAETGVCVEGKLPPDEHHFGQGPRKRPEGRRSPGAKSGEAKPPPMRVEMEGFSGGCHLGVGGDGGARKDKGTKGGSWQRGSRRWKPPAFFERGKYQ